MNEPWPDLSFRPVTNTDADAVRALVFSVLAEHGLQPDPLATDSDLNDLEAHYTRRGGWFYVVVGADGVICGSVGLYPMDATTCELRKMYLAASLRGRGVGRYLLEKALATARELQFRRVTLETASTLQSAIRLYLRYGFRPFTPEHLAARADQAYFLDL